jgi:hypothetical protein
LLDVKVAVLAMQPGGTLTEQARYGKLQDQPCSHGEKTGKEKLWLDQDIHI